MPITTIYGDGNGTRVIGSTTQPLLPQPLHPDVAGYVGRLSANGYSPSATEINAVNNLVYRLLGGGIYDKFQVIYPVIGNSGTTSTLDLKNLCNGTAVNSWTFASTGMKSNGGSPIPYIDTGYNPFVRASQNDMHLSVYVRQTETLTKKIMGTEVGTTQFIQIVATQSAAGAGNVCVNAALGAISSGITDSKGFWLGCRTDSTNQQCYFNGRVNGTNTTNASLNFNNVNRNYYLGAINRSGSATYPSTQEIAFSSIGTSLTAAQALLMYRSVQAYQTELGRQV